MEFIFGAIFIISLIIDYFQTRKILKHGKELNSIVVWFHRKLIIEIYFLLWLLISVVTVLFLPPVIIAFMAGNETHCVWRNWRMGW